MGAKGIDEALEFLRPLCPTPPQIAIVLGSGLGDFVGQLKDQCSISTSEIPGYPRSTVSGHAGKFVLGQLYDKQVICFQGRVHLYEGYSVEQVTCGVRLAAALGVHTLILTNASGGIHRHLLPGTLMIIEDQIDLQFQRRANLSSERANLQPRGRVQPFRWDSPYSSRLIDQAQAAALELGQRVEIGVLGGVLGPSYETPAEVRMLRHLGVDAVSMSTVAEAAAGASLGLDVLGLSCITNRATGLNERPLNHQEVMDVAQRVQKQFVALLKKIIRQL